MPNSPAEKTQEIQWITNEPNVPLKYRTRMINGKTCEAISTLFIPRKPWEGIL